MAEFGAGDLPIVLIPFPMTFSAISPQMRDFLRCQKRSLPTWEAKTQTQNTSKSTKTWLSVFNESRVQRNEARKLGSINNLPRGWAMMIFRGVTLFLFYNLGGLWKISNENDIEHRGWGEPFFSWKRKGDENGEPFFSWKRKGDENMLLDALINLVFYFILTKCWYRTRVWN